MIRTLFTFLSIFIISSANDINIDTIINKAKISHKHVLIFLHRPNCGFCDTMINVTLPNEKIVKKIKKNFIFVDIDIGDNGDVIFDDFKGSKQEFAKLLGYNFYPSSVFIDENEDVVYGEQGRKYEEQFFKILRFVESYSYENMDIEEFK